MHITTQDMLTWLDRQGRNIQTSRPNFAYSSEAAYGLNVVRALRDRLQQDADRITELTNDRDNAIDELRQTQLEVIGAANG